MRSEADEVSRRSLPGSARGRPAAEAWAESRARGSRASADVLARWPPAAATDAEYDFRAGSDPQGPIELQAEDDESPAERAILPVETVERFERLERLLLSICAEKEKLAYWLAELRSVRETGSAAHIAQFEALIAQRRGLLAQKMELYRLERMFFYRSQPPAAGHPLASAAAAPALPAAEARAVSAALDRIIDAVKCPWPAVG